MTAKELVEIMKEKGWEVRYRFMSTHVLYHPDKEEPKYIPDSSISWGGSGRLDDRWVRSFLHEV